MIRLAMIRHGHTAWNRAGRIQGRTDIALDETATADLGKLCLPPEWAQADVVSSPLQRAKRTAELISGREPQIIDALIEMDWGDWEGQQGQVLRADAGSGFRDIEEWGWDFCPPQGESPKDVWERLKPWLASLQQDTVAVCHIGTMRIILARAFGWEFKGAAPFQVKRNRLFVVEIEGDTLRSTGDPVRLIGRNT